MHEAKDPTITKPIDPPKGPDPIDPPPAPKPMQPGGESELEPAPESQE